MKPIATRLAVPVLVLLSVVPFLGSMSGEFVWDDAEMIRDNPNYSQSQDHGIGRLLMLPFAAHVEGKGSGYYRPLTSMTYWLESRLHSLDPGMMRWVNVILHATASSILFLFLGMVVRKEHALTAAAIFAVHPAHVPSVAWISGRTDVLCAIFLFLSLYLFLRGQESAGHRKGFDAAALIALLCALGSKETAVLYPVILILLTLHANAWKWREGWNAMDWKFFSASILLTAAFLVLHQSVVGSLTHTGITYGSSFSVAAVIQNTGYYVYHLFLPVSSAEFLFGNTPLGNSPAFAASAALVVVILALAAVYRRSQILFGTVLMLLLLVPALGILPLKSTYAAAVHNSYMAVAGAGIVFAATFHAMLDRLSSGRLQFLVAAAGAACVIISGILTSFGTGRWQNDLSLFGALSKQSGSSYAAALLGKSCSAEGQIDRAMEAFHLALERDSSQSLAWFGIGLIAIRRGQYEDAELSLLQAVRYNPASSEGHNNLGNIYFLRKDYYRAQHHYRLSLRSDPYNFEAMYNLGMACFSMGDRQEAATYLGRFAAAAPAAFADRKQRVMQMLDVHER